MPIVARLGDEARVVRVKAAEVLVSFGIVELPGQAGEALKKAQDEYIVSLDMFPDAASNHAAKGWLEAERGNTVVARDALNKATAVEPNYAFPWVVKGVLLAREGKFRRGGGDVEEGPIDRAFLPEHQSAHCGGGKTEVTSSQRSVA